MSRPAQPQEDMLPVVEWWQDLVRAAMRDQGLTQEQLGGRVGADQGTISKLLNADNLPQASSLVGPISRALGVPSPFEIDPDPILRLVLELARDAKANNPEALRLAMDMLRLGARKNK